VFFDEKSKNLFSWFDVETMSQNDLPCQKMNDQLFSYPFSLPMMGDMGTLRVGQRTRPTITETGRERSHLTRVDECQEDSPTAAQWMFPSRMGGRFLLESRPIATVPFMGAGQTVITDVDVYSKYLTGLDTATKKANNAGAGISLDRTIPLVPSLAREIQNPEHYIPKYWVRGGMDTRSVTQNLDYAARCLAAGVSSADNSDPTLVKLTGQVPCTNIHGEMYLG